jgi:predicted PurR-regulated permease PerM
MDRGETQDRSAEQVPDAFVRRVATAVGIAILGIAMAAVVVLALDVFLILFAGVLLGVFLLALRDGLTRYTKLPEGWSLAVVLTVLLAAAVGLGAMMGPQLTQQFGEFRQQLPQIVSDVERLVQQVPGGERMADQVTEQAQDNGMGERVAQAVAAFFAFTLRSVLLLVSFLFIGVFIAIHPRLYADGIVHLLPLRWRPRAREVLGELDSALRWFLVARALAMLFVGVATGIALTLLGVPLALLLAVVAGLLTFIPYLGPIIATVPIVLVALIESPQLALYTLIVYTIIEQIEGNVFEPVVLKRILHLPPVVTIGSQLLGGTLFGMMGIALATPFAAVMYVLTRSVYRTEVLGDPKARRDEGEKGDD